MNSRSLHLLLVEDNPTDALLLEEDLIDAPSISAQLTHVTSLALALRQLEENEFDAVLLDLGLPDSQGMETFHRLHDAFPSTPILVLSGLNDEQVAVQCVQSGAEDYLVKGEVGQRVLVRAILYAIERQRTQRILRASRDFYLTLLEEFPALIWRADTSGSCDYFNKSWLEFTGRTMDEIVGDGWTIDVHPDDLKLCLSIYQTAFVEQQIFQMEYRLRRRDGEYRWVIDYGRPFNDLEGNFAGYLGACYDISEQKNSAARIEDQRRALEYSNRQLENANELLTELSITDALTKLRNRRYFRERLQTEIYHCARTGAALSLVLMDLDSFKSYNDTFGHNAGDHVLLECATLLAQTFRPNDVCARYGGEEFIVLLPNTDAEGALAAAERCRAALECFHWPLRTVTGSFGVATYHAGMKADDLVNIADQALYYCKQNGRNCVTHADNMSTRMEQGMEQNASSVSEERRL